MSRRAGIDSRRFRRNEDVARVPIDAGARKREYIGGLSGAPIRAIQPFHGPITDQDDGDFLIGPLKPVPNMLGDKAEVRGIQRMMPLPIEYSDG